MFFGFSDMGVGAAFLLMLGATILCVVYGIRMWDRGGDISPEELAEESRWAAEEADLEKDLTRGGQA